MANNYHQLSLKDTFSDCKDMFMDDVLFSTSGAAF